MSSLETQLARYFVQVAHSRSISRAAMQLSTTQSNLTARIQQLEEQLGHALLRRHSRGVELTAQGEALLPYCEEIVRISEAAQRAVADVGGMKPLLRIGAIYTAASNLMPAIVAQFLSANRGVHVRIRTGSTEDLRELILDGQLDCAVISGVGVDSLLQAHARVADSMGWVCKRGLLKPKDKDLMKRLTALPIYATKWGASYEASVRQLFQDAGLTASMPLFQELGSAEILRAVLHLGQGFTFVSRRVFADDIAAGVLDFHPVPNDLPRLHPTLVTRARTTSSDIVRTFIAHFQRMEGTTS